jgi:putative ABC transport system substrate-binding protein
MQAAAHVLGLTLEAVEAQDVEALGPALARAVRSRAEALIVLPDPLTLLERRRIAGLAVKHRLPAMYGFKEFVMAGGLMSYGTMQTDLYRRAAAHVDKILRGRKPHEVPVEQATRFELVINLPAAKGLGLSLPQSLLLRADELVE